jgi:quercetin dioxygenase-like cupin family protein
VHVLWPGEPNGLYHSESVREAFLVLAGECTLLVEEEERPLRQWDFFHCPAGTNHTPNPDEAYANWPGGYLPARLPWPVT